MPLQPSMIGRVALDYNPNDQSMNFYARHEQLKDHAQLPQFLPRTRWLGNPSNSDLRSLHRLQTHTIDWNDQHAIQALHDEVDATYPDLQPMPPFEGGTYDDTHWKTHVAFMHGVLSRAIAKSRPLEDLAMCALLRTISYGMYDTMTFLQPWHLAGPSVGVSTRQTDPLYQATYVSELGIDMKDGTFQEDGLDQQHYIDRMTGRRWAVAPIKHGGRQWGMTIFDHHRGHLYIFDCDYPDHREERVEACVHLWARFWNWLGMPWSFQYFVPGVTHRPGLRDSGLAAVMWVMLNLRNQVGQYMEPGDPKIYKRDFIITYLRLGMPLVRSDLPLHDWVPDGCMNSQTGIQGVESILRVLVCNELGLRNNPHIKKPFGTAGQRKIPLGLLNMAKNYMENDVGFPYDEFWTGNGGPQFSLPLRSSILAYPGSGSRFHRRQNNIAARKIKKSHAELTKRTAQKPSIVWPQGRGYTYDRPYDRAADKLRLMVTGIEELDEQATEAERHIRIKMRNAASELGHQAVRHPLHLRVVGPHFHLQNNGQYVLRFRLEARVGGDDAHALPFDVPLPAGFVVNVADLDDD